MISPHNSCTIFHIGIKELKTLFVPHINLWELCYFAKVADGPQTYTLDVLWLQKGAQIHMSEWSQSFTLTKNVGWGFFLCSTPPTQWIVWQPY